MVFGEKNPDAIFYGDTLTNTASGGSVDGTVSYKSSNETIATVDANGKITTLKAGEVTITATLLGNELYNNATATYSLTIYKADQKKDFLFEKGAGNKEITYGESFENAASGGENSPITYKSSNEEIATVDANGAVTALKAGVVTITATNPEDERFNKKEISYQLTILHADQEITWEKTVIPTLTWDESFINVATATTKISYKSSDESVATVDENGTLTFKKAGTVTITATAAKTEQYNEATSEYTITMNKAGQTITFELGTTPETVFNQNDNNFINKATTNAIAAGEKDITFHYSIASGKEYVDGEIDPNTGAFKIKGAGTIVVSVAADSNDRYLLASGSYTLTVKKAEQKISFPQETYTVVTGEAFTAPVAAVVGEKFGTGEITYALEDPNGIIKSFDESTGEIEFTYKAGTATITATKAADANYNKAEAKYTITAEEWELDPNTEYYALTGDTINESGWFTGNVSVTAAEGYVVSYVQINGTADWQDVLLDAVTNDGKDNIVTFYVKEKATGKISAQIVETVKKDIVVPTASIKEEGITAWEKFLTIISLGNWDKETADFTIDSGDSMSGVAKVEYYVDYNSTDLKDKDALDAIAAWGTFTDKVTVNVSAGNAFVVYAKVTDVAGHYVYASTNGLVFDDPAPVATITLPETINGYYLDDVEVGIDVTDAEPYSGIKEVSYKVLCNGAQTDSRTIYRFDNADPKYAELVAAWDTSMLSENEKVVIDAESNNSDDVKIVVTVVDNAGNEAEYEKILRIAAKDPEIAVTYEEDPASTGEHDGIVYYNEQRKAKVVITGRTTLWDDALPVIQITAENKKGESVANSYEISEWYTVEGATANDATHTAYITFKGSAIYNFTVDYTDKVTRSAEQYVSNTFVVDTVDPTGTVTVTVSEDKKSSWSVLLEVLTFGLWSKTPVEISAEAQDEVSAIKSIEYYKSNGDTIVAKDVLEGVQWTTEKPEIGQKERFTIYVKITDYADKYTYISTEGIVVEDEKPEFVPPVEIEEGPQIVLVPVEDDVNGFYNGDVTVALKVIEPGFETGAGDKVYSGLKEIKYEITNMGEKTQEGVLFNFNKTNPLYSELVTEWPLKNEEADSDRDLNNGNDDEKDFIVVDSSLNNSNNVVVKVYAVDNAGNKNEAYIDLKIDITEPTIDVTYDNNDGDTTFEESTYFKADRIATIVITERNFNKDKVEIKLTNTDEVIPVLSEWKTELGEENGDGTTHTATIAYTADGDYTFDISHTDEAGNDNEPVNYGESLAPQAFTIDKTLPTFTVTYDNNEALNGNYYKAQRIATIVVTEHNFETSRVNITLAATDNGAAAALPVVSAWTSVGDVHTATITYAEDALYTFDFDYNDKAGNATADIEEQMFFVDKTNPAVSITKIVDQSANNDEGKIGFVVTATDTNFDVFAPVLTAINIKGERTRLTIGATADITNGKSYIVDNIEDDGIYQITCTVVDKAGNAYSEVTLQRENGSTYVARRSGNDVLVEFTVNRNGSVYRALDYAVDLVKKYYVQNVTDDVVVEEINADVLESYKVTVNGKELTKDTDYRVEETGGNSQWKKYTYTIMKQLFAEEGEYKIVISSKDKAQNDAFSDVKGVELGFVVDRTAPIVTVTGMARNGRYRTETQTVTLVPTDDGGALKTLIVRLVNKDGVLLEEKINLSGDALMKALEEGAGKIEFVINKGMYQNIQIICNDCAVDEKGETNTYDETVKDVTVTPNYFLLFWANRPLRWGSIAGVILLTAAIILVVVLKNRKKEEKE